MLYPMVDDIFIYLSRTVLVVLQVGFGHTLHSPFTHILCSLHKWGAIPGLCCLELEGIV